MSEAQAGLEEVFWLADGYLRRLGEFQQVLRLRKEDFPSEAREQVQSSVDSVTSKLRGIVRACHEARGTEQELRLLRKKLLPQLRALVSMGAGALVSLDWESPSFDHSILSQAGRHTGSIEGTSTDYKRDWHHDAYQYERAFAKQYIDAHLHPLVRAYVTSSGMAAFTTVLLSLSREIGRDEIVLVGEGSYFENKGDLRNLFGTQVRFVNELDKKAVLEAVRGYKPKAIFLDTFGNVEQIVVPPLAALIPEIARLVKRPTYLVLDNSVLGVSFQPLKYLPFFSKLRLLVVESLNKTHQFGLDRVTGGMVWTAGIWADRLLETRMHQGTNMPQASVFALPTPSRKLLERRLRTIERNTLYLAQALDGYVQQRQTFVQRVVYPGLPTYPGYAWTKDLLFHGGYFTLSFQPSHRRVSSYLTFLETVLKEAKRTNVDMNAGSSFGFDVTRIYLTARHAKEDARPFLRISPGTETQEEIDNIKNVLIRAIERCS